MTELILKKESGSIVFFEGKGHTGYAEEGSDIVCASVSSVLWCTVNGLINVLNIPISYEEKDGFLSCEIRCAGRKRTEADILLRSMELFIDELQKQYPAFVKKSEV